MGANDDVDVELDVDVVDDADVERDVDDGDDDVDAETVHGRVDVEYGVEDDIGVDHDDVHVEHDVGVVDAGDVKHDVRC